MHSPLAPHPMLDSDMVLRAQGADPGAVRARSRFVLALAERAVLEGNALSKASVARVERRIDSVRHQQILLEGGGVLSGPLVGHRLAAATAVMGIVVTIGDRLEQRVSEVLPREPGFGLALDGFGSAAVEALAVAACEQAGAEATARGLRTTLPLSPGMIGWDVATGQRQILGLLGEAAQHLRLTPEGLMLPRKSLSMVVGLGSELTGEGEVCDYCSLRDSCRHRPVR
jgi:hypothetical protein